MLAEITEYLFNVPAVGSNIRWGRAFSYIFEKDDKKIVWSDNAVVSDESNIYTLWSYPNVPPCPACVKFFRSFFYFMRSLDYKAFVKDKKEQLRIEKTGLFECGFAIRGSYRLISK